MWSSNTNTNNTNNDHDNDIVNTTNNNNNTNNSNEINQKVLERLALLENEVTTLKKEIKKKDRRIRYSSSTKKVKGLSNESTYTADTDGLNMSDSIAEEDVFRVNDPSLHASMSDSFDMDDSDLKMVELAAHASEAVGSMNSETRRSRSFRFNSFITRRINADDDYKVRQAYKDHIIFFLCKDISALV